MAFPVPDHLPRNNVPNDVSSLVLGRISETSKKDLTSDLVASWISELQLGIEQTQDKINERINEELPNYKRQFETSKSVQVRLQNLKTNVDTLSNTLSDSESGLLPTLIKTLREHSELAQRTSDACVLRDALSYLDNYRALFTKLRKHTGAGELCEAVNLSRKLGKLLGEAPPALAQANVMVDMKGKLRALTDQIEEQLVEACSRGLQISATEFRIFPSVQVRKSQVIISLSNILSSLSNASLNSQLSSLKRDIISHFIDFPLQQATSSSVAWSTALDGSSYVSLSLFPLSPHPNFRKTAINYLRTLFDFLIEHLFASLPSAVYTSFSQSLYKPTVSTLLRSIITPSIPTSVSQLPSFFRLVQDATDFEKEYFCVKIPKCYGTSDEGDIGTWSSGVASHFGRKRRVDILAEARTLTLSNTNDRTTRVEVAIPLIPVSNIIPVQGDVGDNDDSAWGFDGPKVGKKPGNKVDQEEPVAEESGWDFEEELPKDDSDAWGWGDNDAGGDSAPGNGVNKESKNSNGETLANTNGDSDAPSNDSEESAWDSVWDEPVAEPPTPPSPIHSVPTVKAPKVARGLEKLSAKSKDKVPASPSLSIHSTPSSIPTSPAIPSSISSKSPNLKHNSSLFRQESSIQKAHAPSITPLRPPTLSIPGKEKVPETYEISTRAQEIVQLIKSIFTEGQDILATSAFSQSGFCPPDSGEIACTIVLQASPAVLDLYRAVFPVVTSLGSSKSVRAMSTIKEQMHEALEHLHALETWWFEEGIERECDKVLEVLARAEGFVDTGDQDIFDACENVMTEVLRSVRNIANEWKPVLPHTKWLKATGRVVDAVLVRVLSDVLALGDIPEVDSRRLAELCRILSSLESSFFDLEDPNAPSRVVEYVPSWLKFSYLSELLEASIADVSYLFDEGTLIDFTVDELVGLIRALFADTPLRSNTIAKIQRGHPFVVE
ncbi:kinase subdomain-containing [Pyrrhoderma noxium]|uniref:Kinase subdomain-containing n=1 Tax=Pyrrhoderma noxium TaxID=2282107 RepID=A0A286UKI7_9AGAM|nr:kinase subdomain-containing [Pyrrhoderma noxium]